MWIDSPEELQRLIKKLNIEVHSPQQLAELLATLRSMHDPEEVRQRSVKHYAITATAVSLGIAGIVTPPALLGVTGDPGGVNLLTLLALVVIWTAAVVVSLSSLVFMASAFRRQSGATDRYYGTIVPPNAERGPEVSPFVTRPRELP
jgi:hypothetical protein